MSATAKEIVEAAKAKVEEKKEPELKAKDLSQQLSGTISQREKEERSIILTMRHGERPEVAFNGFWNGKLVNNAMNAISRGYRLRRHKQIRARADVPNEKE